MRRLRYLREFRTKENLLLLLEIEPRFLSHATRMLVTITTVLSSFTNCE